MHILFIMLTLPDTVLHVSRERRELVVTVNQDTVYRTPASIGSGTTLTWNGRRYVFRTPTGVRRIRQKEADPVWIAPDWHYVELARARNLHVRYLSGSHLTDHGRVVVRDSLIGIIRNGVLVDTIPVGTHIVIGNTLYIPPIQTRNRRFPGVLGSHKFDLGNGILIHGSPDQRLFGEAVTHGCIRVSTDALTWLYTHISVGTIVRIT